MAEIKTNMGKITVKAGENTVNVSVNKDYSKHYAELSKDWAIKTNGLVLGEDYSSKHYAELSKENKLATDNNLEVIQDEHTNITNEIYNAYSTIQAEITQGIEDINNCSNSAINNIQDEKNKSITDINTAKQIVIDDINTLGVENLADTNLSNLTPAGESHFDTRYLNQDEVAYGITELPNRIKWKLENNVFTLQAGSVVLVPYGKKDLTEQLPIGSSFIHENWKVVDTQFDSGDTPRFFVWATNLEDITSTKETTNKYKLLLTVEFATNSIARASTADVSSNTPTDSTNPTKHGLFYNAYSNYCYYFRTTGENSQNMSLPFGISESTGTNVFDKVNQIFNGIGFIGSTIFVDKGIKAKVAYGFENGKRISRQLVTNNVQLRYNALSSQNTIVLYLADDGGYAIGLGSGFNSCESIYQKNIQYSYWYINNKNQTFVYNNETAQNLVPISKFSVENSNVNTLTPFSTNHLVGYDEFIENSFGKWHGTGLELQSGTAISSTTSNTYDLSSFIPKDGNNYEILLDITVNAPKANFGKFVVATASSSIQANTFVGRVVCMDANYANITQVVTYFPIGADRKLTISGQYSTIAGTYSLYARGYRKIR